MDKPSWTSTRLGPELENLSSAWLVPSRTSQASFKGHLKRCKTYIERTIMKTIQANNPFRNSTMAKGQRALNFPCLSPAEKSELDFQAAVWCFMGNHSFRMFENPFGKKFLHALNPAYKPPSRKTLSGPLLDSTYASTQTRMNELIAPMPNLNIVTDESSNIAGARICNITIHSASGSLHYISEDIRTKQMNAAAAAHSKSPFSPL